MKNDRIEMDILLNPLLEKTKYQMALNKKEIEELNILSKEKEEFNKKRKNFFYKEKILYNTLPNEHFQKLDLEATNLNYYENYFKQEEDFDCKNFENIMNMRKNYLNDFFNEKKEEEEKEKEKEKKEGEKEEKKNLEEKVDDKKGNKDVSTLFNDLKEMLENFKFIEKNDENIDIYFSVIETIFNNIFFEFDIFNKNKDFNIISKYEIKLSEIVDTFQDFLLQEKNSNSNIERKIINILYQLQQLSLLINSCGVFLKILRLMKKENILFDNYNSIYEKYFKFNLYEELFKKGKEKSEILFSIPLSFNFEFFTEDKYLYLCYNNESFQLDKYDIEKKKKIFGKELKIADDMGILNDKQNNKIKLLLYNTFNFELLIINKNNFSIEKTYKIKIPTLKGEEFKLTQIINSLNYFYIIVKDKVYILNKIGDNYEFKLLFKNEKILTKNKSFFFLFDDYIFFNGNHYIDLNKKKIIYGLTSEKKKDDIRDYLEIDKEIKYSLKYRKKMKGIEEIEIYKTSYKNKKLSMKNENDIMNKLEEEREKSYNNLKKNFSPKEEKDNIKQNLNYTNNLDLFFNSENEINNCNYKKDEILSNDYYEFIYISLIKFYFYASEKALIANDKLIMNINNEIMFNEIKEIIKEKKDFILLYIYTYSLAALDKNDDIDKNELNKQIKAIIELIMNLAKENSSPYLFHIMKAIYKLKPEHMNSSNISENLLDNSSKLTFEEIIYNFSLISLNNNENFELLLKKFLEIEKKIILSEEKEFSYDKNIYKEVCNNFLNYFLSKKSYKFNDDKFWEKFEKIIIILIEDYISIMEEYNQFNISAEKWLEIKNNTNFIGLINCVLEKKNNLMNNIINSVVCQSLFFLINIIYYQIDKIPEKDKTKMTHILKLLIKSEYITNKITGNKEKENLNKDLEEIIIINSDNIDLENKFEILIPYNPPNKNLNKLYLEYDVETNYEYKLQIGKLPSINECPSYLDEEELDNVGLTGNKIIYNNIKDKKNNDNKKEYQRFKLKFSNFKKEESNMNILTNIRKSIIFCIIKLFLEENTKKKKTLLDKDNKDNNIDIEKKSKDKRIKELISNEFFNNISLLDNEDNIINIQDKNNKNLSFDFNEVINDKDKNIKTEYETICNKINSIFGEDVSEENIINIDTNINIFNKNLSSKESYKKLMEIIHKEFLVKNIWGSMSDSLLRNIITSCFAIIVSDYNLTQDFDELAKLLQKDEKLLKDNKKFEIFVTIYSKINNIKKMFSKKKHEFSLKKKCENEEEELLKKFLEEMNSKLAFIIEHKKIKNDKLKKRKQTFEESIIFLLDFISDEKITKDIIINKIEELNSKVNNKIKSLDCMNKMLFISDKSQDIKNIINGINLIIKNGKNKFKRYEKDLKGADNTLIINYKKQIYIFLIQIISRIKSDKNKYDISYYNILFDSLFWPFSQEDNDFLYMSKLYEILLSPGNKYYSLLHDLNSRNYNSINIDSKNIIKISNETLLNKAFDLFKLMSFIAINEINNDNNKKIPLIKYIFDFIFEILNKYIEDMDKLKKEAISNKEILNEEKLNNFLLIFYRCILNGKNTEKIINIIQQYYENIFTVLFNLFLYSSTKNKILTIKIISILLMENDSYLSDLYLKNNYQHFVNDLKIRNINQLNLILSKKVNHIENVFIEFLFNLIVLLQQNIDNSINYINGTENNLALSFIIIRTLQKKLKKNDNSKIWNEIVKFIELNYMNKKYLSIILQILGVEFDYCYIGAKCKFQEKEENGIIIGYTNNIYKEENQEQLDYKEINFSKGRNILYINEEDIKSPDNFKSPDFTLDIIQKYQNVQNITIMGNNKLILPKEKNELIYKNLLKNISNFQPKEIYLILKYIKMNILQEKINLDEETMSLLIKKSLDKKVLKFHCKIINIERLENLVLAHLCEINKNVLEDIEEKKPIEEVNINTNSEGLFVDPNSPDILLIQNSLFYRFGDEHSLGINIPYKKILNCNLFNESKTYLKIFNDENNCSKYNKSCILLTKKIIDIKKVSQNVKYIIINDIKDEDIPNIKIQTIPIIILESFDFKKIFEHAFEEKSFEEAENLFLQNLETDISLLIDIPFDRLDEFPENQRDFLLEILNIEPNYYEPNKAPVENEKSNNSDSEDNEEKKETDTRLDFIKKIFCGNIISEDNINLIFKKLIALISRRILVISSMIQKSKMEPKILKNIIRLLSYETLSENCSMVENKNYEIHQIIKNFVLKTSSNNEYDIIKELTDLSFLEKDNLINDGTAKTIETEEELINSENLNNNILLINMYFLAESAKENNKNELLGKKFLFNYISLLIKQDLNLVISFLVKIFKHIENNIDEYYNAILENKNIFNCDEFKEMFNYCENLIKEHIDFGNNDADKKFNESTYEKIELIFSFFNIDCIFKYKYGINLEINYLKDIENSPLLSIHTILSILLDLRNTEKNKNNSELNYYHFVEICYQKSLYKFLINNEQFTKPLKTFRFNYYDKNFDSNFVINYQNLISKDLENNINNISLVLKSVDNKIINEDNCVFIYESEKCNNLQDYIKISDAINDKRILLISPNFTISFPNSHFKCHLFGSGSNEKNSLGIQENSNEKFSEPHICVGLEECKNIIDFKFGYYHTFVQSADQNLFTCGTDNGSSFKFKTEFPYFNKQTYFQSLSKENEGIKLIAANNFNSSILLTNNNKLFGCGKNSAYCLGNIIEENQEIYIPEMMPEFLPLIKEINYPYIVKEIACGFKSTLFLLEEGYAFTLGSQDFRQCGSKEKSVPYYKEYFPLYPPRGTKFIHAVAGEEFFLLLVEETKDCGYGKLYSLGQNEFGRSGTGELNTNYTLQRLESVEDKDFMVISSRNENAAAISTEGILYTFGNNSSYALGLGDNKNRYIPTKVSTLEEYYICNHVGISQNHMVIIAREKKTGKRVVLTCGNNEHKALCKTLEEKSKYDIPTKIEFFEEKRPDDEPIMTSLSRFQTYLMSIKVDLKTNINKNWPEFKCTKCKKEIQYSLYIDFRKNNDINYYCHECALSENKDKSFIYYVLNTINADTKNNIEKIIKEKIPINELNNKSLEKMKDKYICKNCNEVIENKVYQSYSNNDILLCGKCFNSKCPLIEYPQLFITYDSQVKPKIDNKVDLDKIIYPNIIKTEKPYLELDLVANYKKDYIIKELYNNKELRNLYDNTWKMINKDILVEMRRLKEFYDENKFDYLFEEKKEEKEEEKEEKKEEKEEKNEIKDESNDIKEENEEEIKIKEKKEENKKETKEERMKLMQGKNYEYLANIAGKSNKYFLYEIIKKLLDIRDKTGLKNTDFQNLDIYIKDPDFYSLVFAVSNFINFQILKILSLSIKFPFANNIFNKILESSSKLITSQERKEIFLKSIEKDRVEVNFENEEISISRIKANVFYTKNILDNEYQYTVFSQLFRKTRSYPQKNYLCEKNNRLFKIRLIGEGATDFSGVYNEVISIISFELESNYLDLFIKTPNNKNEIGSFRDKYMPNPKAKGKIRNDMFYFLGNLMLHSLCSGNVLNLNLHPIFYKKLLKNEIDFSEIETLDKLSYKLICNLEKIKSEEEFNETHNDLYFAVHSSGDNSLIELVENGQNKKVTYDNLSEFINLYKKFLLSEYDSQISFIRSGLFDNLTKNSKKNFSSLISSQDLEDFITGIPKLDIQLLREKTSNESYEPNSKVILNFWKALESFTEEEKSLYLKFVSGRTRLPDARSINFVHKIQKLNKRNPDDYMPTSTTCYFTLNLPEYSTYEILRDKLRYVIHNCNSIDADFVPEEGADQFDG